MCQGGGTVADALTETARCNISGAAVLKISTKKETHMEFWKDNKLHRDGGPAIDCIKMGLAYQEYWRDGHLDRTDGPAIAHESLRAEWWSGGQRHRVEKDGPALTVNGKIMLSPIAHPLVQLNESPQEWLTFPNIQNSSLASYFTNIFGKHYDFSSVGDFGALPTVLASHMGADFSMNKLSWRVDNGRRQWDFPSKGNPSKDKREDSAEGKHILDLLGEYRPDEHMIVLYVSAIAECAEKLDAGNKFARYGPSAMSLATMVFIHELGHAIHRLRAGFERTEVFDDYLNAEKLAQHFTMTAIRAYGVRVEDIFIDLEKNQPPAYSEWRKAGATSWENCRKLFS